jgi:hypothetical protein
MHGHMYTVDAGLAPVARWQQDQATAPTSEVDDLEKLVLDTVVKKVWRCRGCQASSHPPPFGRVRWALHRRPLAILVGFPTEPAKASNPEATPTVDRCQPGSVRMRRT